jgi:hypothetical protein
MYEVGTVENGDDSIGAFNMVVNEKSGGAPVPGK